MIKSSEALDLARTEYINGYEEKDTTFFPTLNLIAKEFSLSLSTLRKKAANEGWYKRRKQHQNAREEYEIRKQFRGKYSKLAQISRNTLVFVEYFQSEIRKEMQAAINGKKEHSIKDKLRLINITQKIQRLSNEAQTTLNNLEDDLLTFIE